MNQIISDYFALLFKYAELGRLEILSIIERYLQLLHKVFVYLVIPCLSACALLILSAMAGIESEWWYQALIIFTGVCAITMSIILFPILASIETILDILPDSVSRGLSTWLKRYAIIIFAVLGAIIAIRLFRLYENPSRMVTIGLLSLFLALGVYIGWLRVAKVWARAISVTIPVTVIAMIYITLFPGPSNLAGELVAWSGDRLESSVFEITRPQPERWEVENADDLRFVDEGTGKYLVWYYVDSEGNYVLYKAPGYGPLGDPLEAADEEKEILDIIAWKEQQDEIRRQQVLAEERAALRRKQEAERLAKEQARLTHIERIKGYITKKPAEPVDYIVFCIGDGGDPNTGVSAKLTTRLNAAPETTAVDGIFTNTFVASNGYERVVTGAAADDFAVLDFDESVEHLIFIKVQDSQIKRSETIDGLYSYTANADVQLINPSTGSVQKKFSMKDVVGAGVTDATAKGAFQDRLIEAIIKNIQLNSSING